MIFSIIIFLITYFLIATEKIDKTVAALIGGTAMLFFQIATPSVLLSKIDINVLGLLIGMMIMVDIIASTGFFEWLAIVIAKKAKGRGLLILIEFVVITAILSALLDNVTTIILIAPITILICQILEIPTVPLLILEALFSNIGGTATMIGDPPNIIIGSKTSYTFLSFITNLAPIVIVVAIASILVICIFFRKSYKIKPSAVDRTSKTIPALAIVEPLRMKKSLIVFSIALIFFFLSHFLHIEAGVIAIAFAMIMILVCNMNIHHILAKVEWGTIMFFVGLFMLIGGLESAGVIEVIGNSILSLTQGNLFITVLTILWVSAILSAIIDNIPLVIAMIPMIKSIVPIFAANMGLTGADVIVQIEAPMFWALALGACFGGNGTLVGASANIIVSRIATKNNYKLSFWDFTKYGIPITLVSLVLSSFYIYLRYF